MRRRKRRENTDHHHRNDRQLVLDPDLEIRRRDRDLLVHQDLRNLGPARGQSHVRDQGHPKSQGIDGLDQDPVKGPGKSMTVTVAGRGQGRGGPDLHTIGAGIPNRENLDGMRAKVKRETEIVILPMMTGREKGGKLMKANLKRLKLTVKITKRQRKTRMTKSPRKAWLRGLQSGMLVQLLRMQERVIWQERNRKLQ